MGSGVSTENMTDEQYKEAVDKLFAEVASIRESNPGNRCVKYLTREVFDSYERADQMTLYKCARTGIENKDSGLGCYQ
jgi:hypothetical protein